VLEGAEPPGTLRSSLLLGRYLCLVLLIFQLVVLLLLGLVLLLGECLVVVVDDLAVVVGLPVAVRRLVVVSRMAIDDLFATGIGDGAQSAG